MAPQSAFDFRRRGVRAVLCLGLLAGLVLSEGHAATNRPAPPRKKIDRSEVFFADPVVRLFQIEVSDAARLSLERSPRTYVAGTVCEGDQVFTNVGLHLKGMGSFRPIEEKPSLVLNFDKFVPDRDYSGITKLMLNNSVQDSTYLAELLATGLFRDAGVPAARVTHARVRLNGRDLGLYTAIEGMNKRFLKRHFPDATGNLYEGYLRDITYRLDQDGGTNTTQADVRALLAACRLRDPAARFQALRQRLDVERFVSFAAMEMLIAHWDGYTLKTNNYRLYHDPATDQMVFIPHGMDAVFRRLNVPVTPPMRSTVSRALFQTAEGRRLYEDRLRVLYTNVFRLEIITNRMEAALAKLRGLGLSGDRLASIERQCGIMRTRIAHRIARVGDQLTGLEPTPLWFGGSGLASLNGWREEQDRGEPVHDRVVVGGRATLHIQAGGGGACRASWRTMVFLNPGQYRFEGQVRTGGIATNGYADLRISGDTRSLRVTGSNPWQELQHVFLVDEEPGTDVELVCELNAPEGEVWFDLESLRLRRL